MLASLVCLVASCQRIQYVSMRPLEDAGMHYNYTRLLEQQDMNSAEVDELVKVVRAGVGEPTCVSLISIAHAQKARFAEGDAVAALHAAGIADATIVELAQLRQIAPWSGEAAAIRLTGNSDRVIVAMAKQRAAGAATPSGASLAKMKDAGVSEATIIELIGRGLSDSDAASIEWRKKKGWKDEQILAAK